MLISHTREFISFAMFERLKINTRKYSMAASSRLTDILLDEVDKWQITFSMMTQQKCKSTFQVKLFSSLVFLFRFR